MGRVVLPGGGGTRVNADGKAACQEEECARAREPLREKVQKKWPVHREVVCVPGPGVDLIE